MFRRVYAESARSSSLIASIDNECRGLLQTARQLNDVNRRVRNLLAANVEARLDVLAGRGATYRAPQAIAG